MSRLYKEGRPGAMRRKIRSAHKEAKNRPVAPKINYI